MLDATHRKRVGLVVVVQVSFLIITVHVQVPRVIGIVLRRRPEVRVGSEVVVITIIVAPTAEQNVA